MNRITILLLSVFLTYTCTAQKLNQAIDLLKENKLNEAQDVLKTITNEKEKPFAYLTQSLISSENGHYLDGLNNFIKFYDAFPDHDAYIYAFSNSTIFTNDECIQSNVFKNFFEKIIDDPKTNLIIKSYAFEELGKYYKNKGDLRTSQKYYDKLQEVKNWSTVGVFENMSGSGFYKDFGVLEHPEKGYKFTNKNGANVTWFTMGDARSDHWWDFDFHYNIRSGIIYAQTFIKSDEDMPVDLMLGLSGSVKIWVNDFLVCADNEERNTDNDVYQYQVKLNKGYNRILLQLGCDEIENNNYMLRIANLDGSLLNLESTETPQPYSKASAYEVKQLPFFPEKYFEDKLKIEPNDFLDLFLLLNVYNHNDKRHEARKLAAKLKQLAPSSTIVAEVNIEALTRDYDYIDATKERESIKSNDGESLYGLILSYNEAMDKEDYDDALKLLNKRVELYGSNVETESNMISVLFKKNETEKLVLKVNEDYALYPDNLTFALLKYYLVLGNTKDIKKANAILKDYLKNNYSDKVIELLSENYFKDGDKKAGIKIYKQLIEDEPIAIGRYVKLASNLFDMNEREEGLEWQQKAIDLAPYIGSLYYTKALMYEAMNKMDDAKTMMQQAIYYDPTNYDARKKMRSYLGQKDLFSFFKSDEAEKIYKDALEKNAYENEHAVYLLDIQNQVVYPEKGAVENKYEVLVQVLDQSGINAFKELTIPFNSYMERLVIEKAEVLKKDGTKVTADSKDNELVFSSLEKGDGIHIVYKLESYSTSKLAEHFSNETNLNGTYPEEIVRYSLIVPKDKKFQYKVYNTTLEPTTSNVDSNFKLYVWEKDNIAGINPEALMPASKEIVERLVVTSIPNWQYLANWYGDLSSNKIKVDFEIKEKVKELLAGKTGLSDYQKANIIYDFIEQNFNYSNVSFLHSAYTPQRASRTLSAKLGDCKDLSTLFVAMCQEAGLDANLVLVNTRDNGVGNDDLPTIIFNHCIAEVHLSGKKYLVELTNSHLPFGALTSYLINANCLYIPKDGKTSEKEVFTQIKSINSPANTIERKSEISFNGMNATLHRFCIRTGAEAASTRSYYKDLTEEKRIKDLTATLSNEFNKNVKIDKFIITNENNLNDSISFDYNFLVDNYCSEIAGMQVFKLPWTDVFTGQEWVTLEQRKFPIDIFSLAAIQETKETLIVDLSNNKKLVETPQNVILSCPAISYSLKFELKNNKLYATREIKYLKDKIMPNEYPEFKTFINKITEADNKQLAMK